MCSSDLHLPEDRIDNAVLEQFYDHEKAVSQFGLQEDGSIRELQQAVDNG